MTPPPPRRTCVVCNRKRSEKEMHQFTMNDKKRSDWVNAVRSTTEGRRALLGVLKGSKKPHLCASHFRSTDYNGHVLRIDAVPFYDDDRSVTSPTVYPLSPVSPLSTILPSTSLTFPFYSSSSAAVVSRPPRPIPLIDQPLPLCCRCCCRPEQESELKEDPNWTPASAMTTGSALSEYLFVSSESLLPLLRKCTNCIGGERSLIVRMNGLAITCSGECTQCGEPFQWNSSKKLPTASQSNKEKLFKINMDIVTGSILSSIGGVKLRQILLTSGISPISPPTFHLMKKSYVIPAVEEFFFKSQAVIIEKIKEKIAKVAALEQGMNELSWMIGGTEGIESLVTDRHSDTLRYKDVSAGEKIHVSGDGSFDSRGYSAAWCRYFLLDAESGEALHYVLMHKSETGSSSTMEVAALEQGMNELSWMIGGTEGIESLICKSRYMAPVRFWVKPIINRCYDAVISAQGNGELAAEKFRAIILCMQGKHKYDKDPSFKLFKECPHSPPTDASIYIHNAKIIKRLMDQVFTAKNIEDIKSVSWLLQTSPCESINALAWRFAPKDFYYIRSGHEMRTKLAVIQWNHLKQTANEGLRPVIRKRMIESPHTTEQKRKDALAKEKEKWERLTRPAVPHPVDSNLEWSSDEEDEEDAVLPPLLSPSLQLHSLVDASLNDLDDEESDNEEQ